MAKIYEAWEGNRPLRSEHFAVCPLQELIGKLNLQPSYRRAALSDQPPQFRIEGSKPELDDIRDASGVFIRADKNDVANLRGWKSGWYVVPIRAVDVRKRLGL